MRRRYFGGKALSYIDSGTDFGSWEYTSNSDRYRSFTDLTQPVYTDGTRGVKVNGYSNYQFDTATVDVQPVSWSYVYNGSFRSGYQYTYYYWNYEPDSFTSNEDYLTEYGTLIDYWYNPTKWYYQLLDPYGYRSCWRYPIYEYSDTTHTAEAYENNWSENVYGTYSYDTPGYKTVTYTWPSGVDPATSTKNFPI